MFAYGDGKNQSPRVWFAMEVEELIVAIVMEEVFFFSLLCCVSHAIVCIKIDSDPKQVLKIAL